MFFRSFNSLNKLLLSKQSGNLKKMAKSKYEYVRNFESDEKLLPDCWIVVRIDGKSFHKFSSKHNFSKPNDLRALNLMNRAALVVMQEYRDIVLAYGESDEYSFVFRKETEIYNRRKYKITSYVNSLFTSSYVFFWKQYFDDAKLLYPPSFDSRVVLYPSNEKLCDYLCWRQVDTHINNLYNTTFWALVQQGGLTNQEAEERLCKTLSSDKNEILFSEFGVNYNDEPIMFKKGTILVRKRLQHNQQWKQLVVPIYEDMTNEQFWVKHSEILNNQTAPRYEWNEDLPNLVLKQLKIQKVEEDNN